MRILTLCGSLRARSSNREILRAYEKLAPAALSFEQDLSIGSLPHFNPDLDGEIVPPEVALFRARVRSADAVVISTPEYAHGLPGAFKNALDWLVSDPAFAGKRIVILHAARGSTWALDSLNEILRIMSANVLTEASVQLPLGTNQVTADMLVQRDEVRALLLNSLVHLTEVLQRGVNVSPGEAV